jgi:hypothetical protein
MKAVLRFEIFKRDAFTCRYCGSKSPEAILEVDHVIPRVGGGSDDADNLVTACYACNRGKGARLLSDIPAESDLHEKAILIAEHELQVAALQHWRMKQRQREDFEIEYIQSIWLSHFSAHYWKTSRVRLMLRVLGLADVIEILEYAIEHATEWNGRSLNEATWIFFCAMATKRIATSRELVNAES